MTHSLKIYSRLITYAKPYKMRLAIGILAGLLSGSSIFGILHLSPGLIRPFEAKEPPASNKKSQKGQLGQIQKIAAKLNIPVEHENGRMTWQFMLLTLTGLPLFVILKALAAYVNRYCMRWVGGKVVVDIRNELFSNLQKQSLIFFGQKKIGTLISRCINETNTIEKAVSNAIAELTRAPIEIVAAVIFVVIYSITNKIYILSLSMFVIFPLCIFPVVILGRRIKLHTRESLQQISALVTRMHENFSGIRVVKAFHTEKMEADRFRQITLNYFRQVMKVTRAYLLMPPLMEIISISGICVLIVYCYSQNIPLSQIVPLAGAMVVAYSPIKRLTKSYTEIQQSSVAANRIFEMLDINTELPEASTPVKIKSLKEKIVFDNVSFSYGNGGAFSLKDISLEIPKGNLVAFVGETGSGKTTLANILARFYDPESGSVLFDEVNLRDIEIESLRSLVGIVLQETILFNDTLYNNIAYGGEWATQEQVVDAAKKANAHEFIVADPAGYQRVVGDKGFILSGGQKQRIAIARTLLRNPEILILDEATSSLDTITEQLIQEAMDRLMKNRTVFAIAHRLSTVKNANRIFVLDDGKIIEQGSHDELLALGGKYSKLYEMQFN